MGKKAKNEKYENKKNQSAKNCKDERQAKSTYETKSDCWIKSPVQA